MKPSRVIQNLVATAALSMPLASTGCLSLTDTTIETILPNVDLYDVDLNGELGKDEVEKYIRIEIAKGHTGPLTKEELEKLGAIVSGFNNKYKERGAWSDSLKKTRVNLLEAYDKYRSLIYPTDTESTSN